MCMHAWPLKMPVYPERKKYCNHTPFIKKVSNRPRATYAIFICLQRRPKIRSEESVKMH